MARASSYGLMVDSMQEVTRKTRNTDLAHLFGQMEGFMKVDGKTESNMGMAGTHRQAEREKEDSGRTENEFYMNKCKDINQCCERY